MSGGVGDAFVAGVTGVGTGAGPDDQRNTDAPGSLGLRSRSLRSAEFFPRQDTRTGRDDVPVALPETETEGEAVHVGSFAEWCRAWGFHVEALVSTLIGVAVISGGHHVRVSALILGIWAIGNFYRGRTITSPLPRQLRLVAHGVLLPLAAVAGAVGFFGVPTAAVPTATLAVVSSATVSGIFRVLRWRLQSPIRVLLVGDRVAIAHAAARFNGKGRVHAVAAVLLEPDLDSIDVPDDIMGVPVRSGLEAAPAMVAHWGVDLVVVSPSPGFTSVDFRRLGWALDQDHVSLGVLGVLDSVAPHRITPGVMNGATVTDVRLPRPSTFTRLAKATFDRVAGALLLVGVAPVLFAIVVAVRLDSRGPGLYTQTRVGLNGRHFRVFKMRTMVEDADELKAALVQSNEFDSVLFKMKRDPRVTRVGALLRKTSLDELPQLINVVRGEMSLVGPRPNLPSEVAQMSPDTLRRLKVRPGITGAWQVSGRSDLTFNEAATLDTYYADNWSLGGDASILIRTVKAVLGAKGAY